MSAKWDIKTGKCTRAPPCILWDEDMLLAADERRREELRARVARVGGRLANDPPRRQPVVAHVRAPVAPVVHRPPLPAHVENGADDHNNPNNRDANWMLQPGLYPSWACYVPGPASRSVLICVTLAFIGRIARWY